VLLTADKQNVLLQPAISYMELCYKSFFFLHDFTKIEYRNELFHTEREPMTLIHYKTVNDLVSLVRDLVRMGHLLESTPNTRFCGTQMITIFQTLSLSSRDGSTPAAYHGPLKVLGALLCLLSLLYFTYLLRFIHNIPDATKGHSF